MGMTSVTSGFNRSLAGVLALLAATASATAATPSLVADLVTGEVIAQEEATRPWYPASLTKLMTVYVALQAVRDGRISMDTPFVMSQRAARAAPSKMGFNPGSEVTLDNALKMLMVKSANDLAIMIAEGVSGSVEDFAVEMNRAAAALGMRQSHFVNPNGLFDANHVSSARDMALLARALYNDFPQAADLYGIGALKLGDKVIPTHNGLLGRYPGADGMKTGFVCPSGFNVVGSALRNGRHIVVVVMGSPNARARTIKAASLFDLGFGASGFMRKTSLNALPDVGGPPPNLRQEICGRHKKVVQEDDLAVVQPPAQGADDSAAAFFANDGRPAAARTFAMGPRPVFEPIEVFVGRKPDWTGPVAMARSGPSPAGPTTSATAFAPQQGIGATASRAIAVKGTPDKAAVQKASLHAAPDAKRLKEDKVKKAAREKAMAKMQLAQKADLAKKAEIAKKAELTKKAEAAKKAGPAKKKELAKKPEPAKTASKAKDKEQ
ncbi:MAG: D-alanyl-D-alanine carboxypeptidase [Hyphomicrobiales bacterium]|jgi:D-alanyl-D-alanine carboxypeptidase|nr:D-alanyl-D-alanine carboxypeptidase [Hyphomicrobiales bacterium]